MKNRQTLREQMGVLAHELATTPAKRRFVTSVVNRAVLVALAFLGLELILLYEGVFVYGPDSVAASLHATTASELLRELNPLFVRAAAYAVAVGLAWGVLNETAKIVKQHRRAATAA
jgi:hypothetical protein